MYIKRYKNKIVLHMVSGMWIEDVLIYRFKDSIDIFLNKVNILTNVKIKKDDVLNLGINGVLKLI